MRTRLIKDALEVMISGYVCAVLLIAPVALRAEAEPETDVPCAGVGRIAQMAVETSVDMPTAETAETGPYIASETQEEKENETIYQYTEVYPVVEEEYVEVLPDLDPIIETDIDALIVQVAAEYGLPWELVRAVCYVESGFDPNAKSDHPDYGLMQVWSEVWRSYGYNPSDPIVYDPETNLRMGCRVLRDKIDLSDGDFTKALMRYNKGDGEAMSQWSQGIFSTAYTEKVMERYYAYIRGEN